MLAVGGDDGILGCQRLHHAHRIGFLADVKMQKAPDLLLAVKFGGTLLEAPDKLHLAQ